MTEGGWIPVVGVLPWRTEVQLGVIKGRTRLVGLRLEPTANGMLDAISTDVLRFFPLQELINRALDALDAERVKPDMTELPRINGREHPADFFNWIASAYVTALDANESPTRSIARLWDVSDSTARRWIRQAREQGAIRQAKKIGRRPK